MIERKIKMGKKLLSLLLALSLFACIFSGCSTDSTTPSTEPSETASAQPSPSEPASPAPEQSAPAPTTSTDPSEFDVIGGGVEDESLIGSASIQYPLGDNSVTLTIWKPFGGNFSQMISSYTENTCLDYIAEKTGVNLAFMEPSDSSSMEQFNLMMVSESYPEFVDCQMYSGGLAKAYNDGIIYDLTEEIPQYAPDMWNVIQNSNEATKKSLIDDEGRYFCLYTINNAYYVERGLVIRKDWVDALGFELPKTTDQLFDVLKAVKTTYDTPYTFNVDPNAIMSYVIGAFGVSGFSLEGTGLGNYHVGDKVYSSLQQDGYREYLEYFIKSYNEGIFNIDFYVSTGMPVIGSSRAVNDQTAVWFGMADAFANDKASAVDPNFSIVGLGAITAKEGDSYQFGDLPTMTGRANYSITTNCDNVELALNYLNWFFTEEGALVCNYGLEGTGFDYVNGKPLYNDIIVNNPNGWNRMNVRVVYAFWNIVPFYNYHDSMLYTYADNEADAIKTWTEMGYDCTMPGLSYNELESEEYTQLVSQIATYATETVLKFIVGEEPLNDDTWAALQAQLKVMNIDRALEIDQAAFNRYLER